jgi:hypothetical protein
MLALLGRLLGLARASMLVALAPDLLDAQLLCLGVAHR